MKLQELTTPFETRRATCYKVDRDSITYHNKLMQHVSGNIYRGETKHPGSSYRYCTLYVLYPEQSVAMEINTVHEDYTIDEVMEMCRRSSLDTLDNFVKGIKRCIKHQGYIKLSMIEYLKYIDPSLTAACIESRRVYKEKHDRLAQEQREKKKAEERKYVAERNAEAKKTIANAVEIIRSGGILNNDRVAFFRNMYDSSEYSIINYLMRENGLKVPLKTQGWINDKLSRIKIAPEGEVTVWFQKTKNGKCSNKIFECMDQLVHIVRAGNAAQ